MLYGRTLPLECLWFYRDEALASRGSGRCVSGNRYAFGWLDKVIYHAKTGTVVSRTGEAVSEEYIKNMKTYVKLRFQYSAGILNDDFFKYVEMAVTN